MKRLRSKKFSLLALATVLYAIGLGLAFSFLNPQQCPLGYSQAQVDASDCIIGANIGLPLVLLILTAVWGGAVVYIANRNYKN